MSLDHRQDDLDFSRLAEGVAIDGWTLGRANIQRESLVGWHGRTHARRWVSLEIVRQGDKPVASIFIPLLASLHIPLLALWLQRVEDGEVKIEAFELTNLLIGGVVAVIALDFTVSDGYPMLAASDNPVTRLFALNDLTLAVSLINNIVVFRFGLFARWFGKYAQEQLFLFLIWNLPLIVFGAALRAHATVLTCLPFSSDSGGLTSAFSIISTAASRSDTPLSPASLGTRFAYGGGDDGSAGLTFITPCTRPRPVAVHKMEG